MTIIADGNGNYDGAGLDLVHKLNVEMPILFISRVDGYVFNEKVLELAGKDYCIVDYTELGWNWSMEFSHLWGVNTDKFDFLQGEEWAKLDALTSILVSVGIFNSANRLSACCNNLSSAVSNSL